MGRKSNAVRQRRETGVDPRRKRKDGQPRRKLPVRGHPDDLPTLWNFEPAEARRCNVVVGSDPDRPNGWARDIVGEERRCVEVRYGDQVLYLDDEPHEPRQDEVDFYAKQREALEEAEMPEMRELAKTMEPTVGYHGWAWDKVTRGRGSPRYGHREVPVAKLLGYIDAPDHEPHIVEPELTPPEKGFLIDGDGIGLPPGTL